MNKLRAKHQDVQDADKYKFCESCEARITTPTSHYCPARFNPYDAEKCINHDRFMEIEARKAGRLWMRPTQILGADGY